jgi:hypothetical protein
VVQTMGEDSLSREAGADATGGAGREVDLAQQQHEHQTQRDDRDVGPLAGQVADVVLAQEPVADLTEDGGEDDQPQHRRKRSRLAGPQPADVGPKGRRDGTSLHVQGEVAGRTAAVARDRAAGLSGRRRRHGAGPQMLSLAVAGASPMSPLRPAVISSTICVVLLSFVMTTAAMRPR